MYSLPTEILDEVFNYSPLDTQLVLCRVSTQLNRHALRHIYRKVVLTSVGSVVRCCRTLCAKTAAASAVRSFSVKIGDPHPPCCLIYYSTLRAALERLERLMELDIIAFGEPYSAVVSSCSFPYLTRFECVQRLTPPLASFLNRHPTITYLQIAPSDNISDEDDTDSEDGNDVVLYEDNEASRIPTKITLPNLQCFVGNGACVEPITRASPLLRAAFVFWEFTGDDIANVFSALARACGGSLMMLSCRRRGWNVDLIDAVSRTLPSIRALVITNVLPIDAHPSDATLAKIQASLQRFTDLQRLMLHCVEVWQTGDVECRMDHDWQTAMAWGAACPSLSEITFPHGLKWVKLREQEDIWAPDTSTIQGLGWVCEMIRSRRCPRWMRCMRLLAERTITDLEMQGELTDHLARYKQTLAEMGDHDTRGAPLEAENGEAFVGPAN